MNNQFNALPAAITDQIETMQLDSEVKKIHVVVLSDIEMEIVYKALRAWASVFGLEHEYESNRLYKLSERFQGQPDDEDAQQPEARPMTHTRW